MFITSDQIRRKFSLNSKGQLHIDHPMTEITLIAGPTASGKSALALKIAQQNDGVVINADALQVYASYRLLTARPSDEDQALAPHHLYGHVDNLQPYSVGHWLKEVESILSTIKSPKIIVGGTGLYFKALTKGLADIPEISEGVKRDVQNHFENFGREGLQNQVRTCDPDLWQRVDQQNHRRLMRALEVFWQTGKPLSQWQSETPTPLIDPNSVTKIVVCPDVEQTNRRIKDRFHSMMREGAVDEVQAQLPFDANLPANQALGAKEIASYLEGELSFDEAIELSIIATRQYAKRQRSWLRSHMKDWDWRAHPFE